MSDKTDETKDATTPRLPDTSRRRFLGGVAVLGVGAA
ncbi:twin-arginine translocation signal domain-containing protein, partial [Pseudomonas sp.]